MTLILSGTNGLSDVDGSASTPAIRGTDSNTGIFFPAADTIAFAEGGVEVARFDSSGNLGIGTSSPVTKLNLGGASDQSIQINGSGTAAYVGTSTSVAQISSNRNPTTGAIYDANRAVSYINLEASNGNGNIQFYTTATNNINATERARIDSSGNLLINTTDVDAGIGGNVTKTQFSFRASSEGFRMSSTGSAYYNVSNGVANQYIYWRYAGATVGNIAISSTATAYNTSSDYRLKENIAPMTGALAKVAALKPCTYKWKANGSDGEGFIAHELAEVVPQCVTGEKDAVDAEGNPVYQGIDTSFLVATLTAAIQEQQAIIESLTARIAALEAA